MRLDNKIDWSAEPDLEALRQAYRLFRNRPTLALAELRALADRGSIMSMVYLGAAYQRGRGTKRDLAEAEKWYRNAADAGSVRAYYNLGRIYFADRRDDEARDAFRLAAAADYIPAIHLLGVLYLVGRGVPKDTTRARGLLERASDAGSIFAMRTLARLLKKEPDFLTRCRGRLLMCRAWIRLFFVGLTEGMESDKFA